MSAPDIWTGTPQGRELHDPGRTLVPVPHVFSEDHHWHDYRSPRPVPPLHYWEQCCGCGILRLAHQTRQPDEAWDEV